MSNINWDMVSALGQIAGAMATFAAVVVSLKLARDHGRPQVRLEVSLSTVLGPPSFDAVSFTVINRGSRPVTINSYGWRTRGLRWSPESMWIMHDHRIAHQADLPKTLQPGEQAIYLVSVDSFLSETDRLRTSFFRRNWLGSERPRRLYGIVWTADRYSFKAQAARSVRSLLQDRRPDQLLGAGLNAKRAQGGIEKKQGHPETGVN